MDWHGLYNIVQLNMYNSNTEDWEAWDFVSKDPTDVNDDDDDDGDTHTHKRFDSRFLCYHEGALLASACTTAGANLNSGCWNTRANTELW